MVSFKREYQELMVDGKLIPVPAESEWEGILKTGAYCGVSAVIQGDSRFLVYLMGFVQRYPEEFCLGLVDSSGRKKSWLPMILFFKNGVWNRVAIETVTCNSCGWTGKIANPAIPDLYFGLSDYWAARTRALEISDYKCPQCAEAGLPRPAIWTEKHPGDQDAA